MRSLKAFSLLTGFTLAANVSMADLYTTAAVVEGTPNLKIHSGPMFAGRAG